MRRTLLCFFAGALLFGSLAGLALANPDLSSDLGADFWNLPNLYAQTNQMKRQADELDLQASTTMKRLQLKQAVADEVVAERMTLLEGARIFRNLNRNTPNVATMLRRQYPGCCEAECHCRNLAECVRARVLISPEMADALTRVETEIERRHQSNDWPMAD